MHGGDIYNNDIHIDFSVNLNPYALKEYKKAGASCDGKLSSYIEEAFRRGTEASCLYPDMEETALRSALAEADGVDMECIYAGCGASQLMMAAVRSINPQKALLIEPGFTGYTHVTAAVRDCKISRYYLREEEGFALTSDFIDAMTDDTDMIILADPNNPTGRNIDEDLLVRILDRADELGIYVIADESFLMISDKYQIALPGKTTHECRTERFIRRYKRLYLIRSYTKSFALPGIRMGYVISNPENIEDIRRYLPEWNLPALSEAVMRRCAQISGMGDFYTRSMEMITEERSFLTGRLKDTGLKVYGGNSVFILFKGPEGLYEKMLAEHILIRKCDDMKGLDGHFFRVAVRDHDDNEILADLLYSIMRK